MRPPTKDEHDAKVATTGRPYTQEAVKPRHIDSPSAAAGLTIRPAPRVRKTTKAAS